MVHPVANQPGTPDYGPGSPRSPNRPLGETADSGRLVHRTVSSVMMERVQLTCPGEATPTSPRGAVYWCNEPRAECDGRRSVGTTNGTDWEVWARRRRLTAGLFNRLILTDFYRFFGLSCRCIARCVSHQLFRQVYYSPVSLPPLTSVFF